jgi:NitT/TauT family transport system permease protein
MRTRIWLPPLAVFVLGVLVWEAICRRGLVEDYLLAAPSAVAWVLVSDSRELLGAFGITALCALGGFLSSSLLGVAMAIALESSKWILLAFYPYAVIFQTVPIIAVAPLLVIWFGYGSPTVIASAFIASLFPVIMATLTGLRATRPELRELFRLYRASRTATLFKLVLPMALPSMLTGFRIAAGLAVIGAIVGEFIGGGGLGSVIDSARTQQRLDKVFAAVFLASVLGALAIAGIDVLNRLALERWEPRRREVT